MNIIKSPLLQEEQLALKRILRSEDIKRLVEEAAGKQAEYMAQAATLAIGANSGTQERLLPPRFWLAVQNAEKWGHFKEVLAEMTDESYTFSRFTVKTQ
jgi:hypothetical protein